MEATARQTLGRTEGNAPREHYEAELAINDFPYNARWKVTHEETLGPISDWTGAAITTRGQFISAGRVPAQGQRRLYLFIQGPTESFVQKVTAEVRRVLEDMSGSVVSQ